MKRCHRCKETKPFSEFHKSVSRQDGYQSACKPCRAIEQRAYRKTDKGIQRDKTYKDKYKIHGRIGTNVTCVRYIDQWIEFFKSCYGDVPACQVCGKVLNWKFKSRSTSPVFDHRMNGSELIATPPAHFYRTHPCTTQHKETWVKSNFGCLCNECNTRLPTRNRADWVNNVMRYLQETTLCE